MAGRRFTTEQLIMKLREAEAGRAQGRTAGQVSKQIGPAAHPYAFAVINDVIWYNESGMRPDALVRFDPKTEKFQSWTIPSDVGIIRNFWVTREGNLLIHQTSSNRVGLVKIQGLD